MDNNGGYDNELSRSIAIICLCILGVFTLITAMVTKAPGGAVDASLAAALGAILGPIIALATAGKGGGK